MQANRYGPLRIVYVPECPLTVLKEPAGSDQTRQVRATHPEPVPHAVRVLRVYLDAGDVLERHLEPAFQREELVRPADMDDKRRRRDLHVGHAAS